MPKTILNALENIIEDCKEIQRILSPDELVKELFSEETYPEDIFDKDETEDFGGFKTEEEFVNDKNSMAKDIN